MALRDQDSYPDVGTYEDRMQDRVIRNAQIVGLAPDGQVKRWRLGDMLSRIFRVAVETRDLVRDVRTLVGELRTLNEQTQVKADRLEGKVDALSEKVQ